MALREVIERRTARQPMTTAGDPEPERMVSPGINGMGMPVEGAERPAGWDGQRVWLRDFIGFIVSVMSSLVIRRMHDWVWLLLRLIRPSSAWWHPEPRRAEVPEQHAVRGMSACRYRGKRWKEKALVLPAAPSACRAARRPGSGAVAASQSCWPHWAQRSRDAVLWRGL